MAATITQATPANAAVTEFMNLNQEARWQLVQDTTEWLNRQAVELKAKRAAIHRHRRGLIGAVRRPVTVSAYVTQRFVSSRRWAEPAAVNL